MEWFGVEEDSLEESRIVDASENRTADGTEVIYMVEKRVDGGTPTTPEEVTEDKMKTEHGELASHGRQP